MHDRAHQHSGQSTEDGREDQRRTDQHERHHQSKNRAEAEAGVRLDHAQDGFAAFMDLLRTQRCKHAVVNHVVEEQNLGRLDDDGQERQEVGVQQSLHAVVRPLDETRLC